MWKRVCVFGFNVQIKGWFHLAKTHTNRHVDKVQIFKLKYVEKNYGAH